MIHLFHKWKYYNNGELKSNIRICSKCGRMEVFRFYDEKNPHWEYLNEPKDNYVRLNTNDRRNWK